MALPFFTIWLLQAWAFVFIWPRLTFTHQTQTTPPLNTNKGGSTTTSHFSLLPSSLLCPWYPFTLQTHYCISTSPFLPSSSSSSSSSQFNPSSPSLISNTDKAQWIPFLQPDSSSQIRMKAFQLINKRNVELKKKDANQKAKEGGSFSNVTFLFQLQTFFVEHATLLRKKNALKHGSSSKLEKNQQWMKPFLTLFEKIMTCYDDEVKTTETPTFLCNVHNLFYLHYFLDYYLYPILSSVSTSPSTSSLLKGIFLNTETLTKLSDANQDPENEHAKLRRWILLDIVLHTFINQFQDGFNLSTLLQSFVFPSSYFRLETFQPPRTTPFHLKTAQLEASLRCYQSLNRVGQWIKLKKKTSPIQFWLLKKSLPTFLKPYLEKLLAFLLPSTTTTTTTPTSSSSKHDEF